MNASSSRVNANAVLAVVAAAQFMVVLDATIVNVALPSIQRGLRFSPSSLQWVINMYTLIFGGFILLGGRAGDLIGRKRVFGAGIVLFTGASLLNGLAQSSGMLIAGRGLPIGRIRLHWRGGGDVRLRNGGRDAGSALGAALKQSQAIFELPVTILQLLVLTGELPQLIFKLLDPDLRIDVVGLRERRRIPGERAQRQHRRQCGCAGGFMNPE